jgi:hypothetical protein
MANMLLFLTLEAFFKFSIDDRLVGEVGGGGVSSVCWISLAGELGSRPCQNRRGETPENGEESAGEFSLPKSLPYNCLLDVVKPLQDLNNEPLPAES